MNSISTIQNSKQQLKQLGAFSQLYLNAKRLLGLNLFLSVPMVLVWSIIVALVPQLALYGALWGAGVTLLSVLVLTPAQQAMQQRAAKVHQLFDCEIFELPWDEFNIGAEPEPETIFSANVDYVKGNPSYEGLKNWYFDKSKVDKADVLPLYLARLICQRACCWWDGGLRQRYAIWNLTTVLVLVAVVLILGLIRGLTLETFFTVVIIPLLPALVLGISQYREHQQSAADLKQLREKIEDVWEQAMKQKESPQDLYDWAIKFQDKLFDNRSTKPLIFNWIYKVYRAKDQQSMGEGMKEYVEEAIATLGPFPAP